ARREQMHVAMNEFERRSKQDEDRALFAGERGQPAAAAYSCRRVEHRALALERAAVVAGPRDPYVPLRLVAAAALVRVPDNVHLTLAVARHRPPPPHLPAAPHHLPP